MILKSITLAPFAGVQNKTFAFKSGLNVILGPNDIGKSTLLLAIESVFYLAVKPKGSSIEGGLVKQLIPIGGDHASVKVEFEHRHALYRLEKTWGAGSGCRLVLADGTVLVSEDKVEDALQSLLLTSPGTFKNVLSAGQNKLVHTLDGLRKDSSTLHSLGDLVRASVSQTDGISVDRFQAILTERIQASYFRWNAAMNGPDEGRGIENPWKSPKPGKILQSWYERERLRKERDEVSRLEGLLGEKTKLLREKRAALENHRVFIQHYEPLMEAEKTRQTLHERLTHTRNEVNTLNRDAQSWSKSEVLVSLLEPELLRLDELVKNLKAELESMRELESRKAFAERFKRIESEHAELARLKTILGTHAPVTRGDMDILQTALNQSAQMLASLAASKLHVQFMAKETLQLTIQKDFESESLQELKAGETFDWNVGGRIRLNGAHFALSVSSGNGQMEELEAQLTSANALAESVLKRMGASSIDEAKLLYEAYERALRDVGSAERTLKSLLGTDEFAALKAKFESMPSPSGTRDPSVIDQEFATASAEQGKKSAELSHARIELMRLKKLYQTEESSSLFMLIGEKKGIEKLIELDLSQLPQGETGADEFLKISEAFKKAKIAIPLVSDEIPTLASDVADIKARLPDQTAQDFERQYREADQVFEKELLHGMALQKIAKVAKSLESQSSNLYGELENSLAHNLSRISQNKYRSARLEGSLPTDFIRSDGAAIPFALLSGGIKDSFALALRLALAQYFLKATDGFVLVDDPMVSMDPDRQAVVSELLTDFSQDKQVLVFTCHPGHAELLQGNRVSLAQP